MEQDIVNRQGKVTGKIKLNVKIFDGKVNIALLYQAINSYLANRSSSRIAAVKTRAQVSGSGVKPWRQKGTGRARVGELRNPLWRKGGIVFGPHPRRTYKEIPRRMRLSALQSALNAKRKDKELVILEDLQIDKPKTKVFFEMLKKLKIAKRALFVDKDFSRNCRLSSRNLGNIALARASDLNAYLVLQCKNLVVTKKALGILEERILGSKKSYFGNTQDTSKDTERSEAKVKSKKEKTKDEE